MITFDCNRLLFVPFLIVSLISLEIKAEIKSFKINHIPSFIADTNDQGLEHLAEEFWASVDFIKFKIEVGKAVSSSGSDLNLFFEYLDEQLNEDRIFFFERAVSASITPDQFQPYIENMKQRYILQYPDFAKVKNAFALQIQERDNKTQQANGPAINIDFEEGTLRGWTVKTGTACGYDNCPLSFNSNPGCRALVTNKSMVDPYLGFLPTVSPTGGNHSLRLENFQNGYNQTYLLLPIVRKEHTVAMPI